MPATIPAISPFRLLRPYRKEDIPYYFGRDKETRQLYDALMRSKFMMVYGASGTGKTSLIQCGLQSMYSPRDWMPVLVRRSTDFLTPIREELYRRYRERFEEHRKQQMEWYPEELAPEPETFDGLRGLVKALFHLSYVPIYLILDQFEEIFTLGSREEQDAFFTALQELGLFSEDLFCKVIIVTREEYIAHFYRYEKQLPFLFEHRFRVEKMRPEQLLQVVNGTLTTPYPEYPEFEVQPGAGELILRNLTDERGEVDLTTLQVYLDRLYQEDRERPGNREHILIDKALVDDNKLADVMADFLGRQVERVSGKVFQEYPNLKEKGANLPLQILFQMVTVQGTKQNRSAEEIYKELQLGKAAPPQPFVQACLDEFAGPESRILNRLRFAQTEAERYEIMHDRLAERIFSRFNAEELRRREAVTTIRNKLKRFREASPAEKKQEYLSIGEIELVDQSLNTARLEEELKGFFEESQAQHRARRRRERMITMGAVIAAGIFLMIAVIAYTATQRAQRAETKAEENLKEARSNELGARALTALLSEKDPTRAFRLAQYAFCYDTTNAEAVRVLYNLYFSPQQPGEISPLPMHYNRPGSLWEAVVEFSRGLYGSGSFSIFSTFDSLFQQVDPDYFPSGSYYSTVMPAGIFFSTTELFKVDAGSSPPRLFIRKDKAYEEIFLPHNEEKELVCVKISNDENFIYTEWGMQDKVLFHVRGHSGERKITPVFSPSGPEIWQVKEFNFSEYKNPPFLISTNPLGPFHNFYRFDWDKFTPASYLEGEIDMEGPYLHHQDNYGISTISRFDYGLGNICAIKSRPFQYDVRGLELQNAVSEPPEKAVTPRNFLLDGYSIKNKQGKTVLHIEQDTLNCVLQETHWAVSPSERYVALIAEGDSGFEGGGGCLDGLAIKIWDNQLQMAYALPENFMGIRQFSEGPVYFPDNNHLEAAGYRWMLNPKDIISTFHQKGYWDFSAEDKERLGIIEEEMQWKAK